MMSSGAKAAPRRGQLAELRRHGDGTIFHAGGVLTAGKLSHRRLWRGVSQQQAARLPPLAVALAVVACVAAPLATGLGAPMALKLAAVLSFMCIAPGVAFVATVGGRGEIGLIVGLSLGAVALAAQLMLSLGWWHPEAGLCALAAACLFTLAVSGRVRIAKPSAGRRTGIEDFRRALGRVRGAAGIHALLLPMAMCAWAIGIAGTRLSRMGGIGLLQAVSPAYFVAFLLVLGGFTLAATRGPADPRLLAAYVLTLIVILHATTPLLYDEPRYAWAYKHIGVINLIAATGHANREIDIYNNWPAFFAANAWLSTTAGMAPIDYAAWAQLFFNLVNVAVVRFAVGSLTTDKRLAWTATFFFLLGNWVGQDYLAPQAFAFALSLVVVGLCLRHPGSRRPAVKPWPHSRTRASRNQLDRLASVRVLAVGGGQARVVIGLDEPAADGRGRMLRRIATVVDRDLGLPVQRHTEARERPPLGPRAALVAGGICFVAVVVSHQLSPLLLIVQVTALALLKRALPRWIPVVMIVIEAWWLFLAWPFVGLHFVLLDPGGAAAAAPGRNLAHALPGAKFSFYAPLAVTMSMATLAVVGMIRRGWTDRSVIVPACLIVAPVFAVAFQHYGGEGPYRAYLFALPWLAFLATFSCTAARARPGRRRVDRVYLLAATTLVAIGLLFAYFGQELANHIPADDVRAATWYERHVPAGSLRINLAPIAPDRLTSRYPLVSLADPSSLLEQPGFTGHRLGPADVPLLERYIARQGHHRDYVILTTAQENYGRLNGLLPAGSVRSLTTALEGTPSFRLVYDRPAAWIFEYLPGRSRARGHRVTKAANP
jgi:hypothetical protein